VISVSAKYETSNFTCTRNRTGLKNFKNGSRDPDHILFGTFVVLMFVPAAVKLCAKFYDSISFQREERRSKNLQKTVVGVVRISEVPPISPFDQLSLLPDAGRGMSTGQSAVTLCGWE